jgi:phospholipid-binding lipoprotein MlaA
MPSRILQKNLLAAALLTTLAACANNGGKMDAASLAERDPHQGFNRTMYDVHVAIDSAVVEPVTSAYRYVVPETGRDMVTNFLENLNSPVTLANAALQGDTENAFATFWRMVINTTVGVGGLFDVAETAPLTNKKTDFGMTLAKADADSGDYLFLPILGPGTTRDYVGRIVDIFFDPMTYVDPQGWNIAEKSLMIVDKRSQNTKVLDDIERTSVDPYATIRAGYLQKRASDIKKVTGK